MINWNPVNISNSDMASGFIVQHFTRELITKFSIDIPKNANYYEAWEVVNGIVQDKGDSCDDMFAIGNCMEYFELFKKCVGTSGRYEFKGDVFWIPVDHELYKIVDSWEKGTVNEAGGLKSIVSSEYFDKLKPLFSRNPFIHEWDLTNIYDVYNIAKDMLFKYCHNKCDRELLLSEIDNVIPSEYKCIKEKIIKDWDNQWQ